MNIFLFMGGMGWYELIILLMFVPLSIILIISPFMWLSERKNRKYWQNKAEEYERRLLDKK